jgi:hypothetical protein
MQLHSRWQAQRMQGLQNIIGSLRSPSMTRPSNAAFLNGHMSRSLSSGVAYVWGAGLVSSPSKLCSLPLCLLCALFSLSPLSTYRLLN